MALQTDRSLLVPLRAASLTPTHSVADSLPQAASTGDASPSPSLDVELGLRSPQLSENDILKLSVDELFELADKQASNAPAQMHWKAVAALGLFATTYVIGAVCYLRARTHHPTALRMGEPPMLASPTPLAPPPFPANFTNFW